jgi:hypothetical protein
MTRIGNKLVVFDAGEYTVVGTFKKDSNGQEYVEYCI